MWDIRLSVCCCKGLDRLRGENRHCCGAELCRADCPSREGYLSLEDGLKLIGTRARLMQTKWGPDRSTMVAIHSSIEMVQVLIDRIPSRCQQIEIACYSAPILQVVVGTY